MKPQIEVKDEIPNVPKRKKKQEREMRTAVYELLKEMVD